MGRIVSVLLFTTLDLFSADSLYDIAASGAAASSSVYASPRKERSWSAVSVAAVYVLPDANPDNGRD